MESTKVVIVGAGMAGLSAALELKKHGVDVIVVEANDRVGGRVKSQETSAKTFVDVGGQWVGHDHHLLSKLVVQYDAKPFQTYVGRGVPLIVAKGRQVALYSPSVLLFAVVTLFVYILTLFPPVSFLSGVTLQQTFDLIPVEVTRQLVELLLLTVSCADPERVDVHFLIRIMRFNGGLLPALKDQGGAQDTLLESSLGSLALRLASDVGMDNIRLSAPVARVEQASDAKSVVVVTSDGRSIRADKVIITVPPPMQKHIEFQPALPALRIEHQKASFMGLVYKAVAVYDRPFWREQSAWVQFLVLDKPKRMLFDSSPPTSAKAGHLAILVAGPDAHLLDNLSAEERKELLLKDLVPFLGPQILQTTSWHDQAWHDEPFIGGGYEALLQRGSDASTTAQLPMLRDPVGRIHWAGTETANEHVGYVEGALESGHRVVQEVLASL